MSKQSKKMTLDGLGATVSSLSSKVDKLASAMEAGFKRMDSGFKSVRKEMAAGFEKAEENREDLAVMVANGFERTAENISRLEQGQGNIQLRLDSLAPKFEVKDVEKRVKRLEDKAGIRHSIQH